MGLFWTVGNYSRKRPPFFELVQLGSGRFAFGQLKNWVTLSLLFDQKKRLNSFSLYALKITSQFYTKSFTTVVERSPLA